MATHQHARAAKTVTAGSATLYTNTSGGSQSIIAWEFTLSLSAVEATAGTTATATAQIQIGGTVVAQLDVLVTGVGSVAVPIKINPGGAEYLLANNGTITVVTTTNATNVSGDATITFDAVAGTA